MLQQEQTYRDQCEYEHYRMNIFATANNEIKANVRNEAPEYSLGNREGQGDEDYSQKRGQTLFNSSEIDSADALEHRHANENQHRRGRIRRHHPRERRQKEARQKAECRKHGSHARSPAAVDSRNAFDVSRARRRAGESCAKRGK